MIRAPRRFSPFLLLASFALTGALAGCGDLPQPFAGNPGAAALRLAAPPPPRLDVPTPTGALLADRDAALWSKALVAGLLSHEVPAVAQPRRRNDWSLVVTAQTNGAEVVPHYAILGPNGRVRAERDGAPVPAGQWASSDPAMISASATAAAADINTMLTDLQAKAAQTDPNSLLNRSTRLWLTGVTGAPGDGDNELAAQMRAQLPNEHVTLQTDEAHADYLVSGHVTVSKPFNGVQHVEIVWTVTRTVVGSGGRPAHEAGKATQLHDLPAHSLDGAWGDVAIAAASEAAGGVREVISNNEGRARPRQTGTKAPDGPLVNEPLAAPPTDSLPPPKA
ncbi:hypothetical protein NFI95_14010 [Acetobacteraceae bacterium KSS8]|uniref:Lipoprotein n=1 Tax=Endosaccharibacter trunci TaxID=2812733 RepID=A0ABT1WBR5_9PROT|nr:hypothetical protein [Acetobacteraceae bacterium KSS8]